MTDAEKKQMYLNLAVAAGLVYAVYRFAPNGAIKAMALGVGGVMAAKQLPYLRAAV